MKKGTILFILIIVATCAAAFSGYALATKNETHTKNQTDAKSSTTHKSSSKASIKNMEDNNSDAKSSTNSEEKTSSDKKEAPITQADAMRLLQSSDIHDTEYNDSMRVISQTSDGGIVVACQVGAKGENHFTLTPESNNQVKIDAVYGSLSQGGFTPIEDQSTYGPSQAIVSR